MYDFTARFWIVIEANTSTFTLPWFNETSIFSHKIFHPRNFISLRRKIIYVQQAIINKVHLTSPISVCIWESVCRKKHLQGASIKDGLSNIDGEMMQNRWINKQFENSNFTIRFDAKSFALIENLVLKMWKCIWIFLFVSVTIENVVVSERKLSIWFGSDDL